VAIVSKRLAHTVMNEMLRPTSYPNTSMSSVVRYLNDLDSHGKTRRGSLKFQHFVDRDLPKAQLFVELAAPLVSCRNLQGDTVGASVSGPRLDALE
jgi:hypothetical protein